MARGRSAAVAISLAALLNACAAQRLGLTWEIVVITPKVRPGGDLVFRVEAKDAVGEPVEGVQYVWVVNRNSVEGNSHRGSTPNRQRLLVEGSGGPGEIRVYAANDDGSLILKARAEFRIE